MVATAIARLVEVGAVGIDDPVAGAVSEVRGSAWGEAATIRHLLANTSGLTLTVEREFAFDGDDALARLSESVAKDSPVTEPGTAWSYGDSGWAVLGRVIECATGQEWEAAMRTLVFDPMGLHDTGFITEPGPRTTNYAWQGGSHVAAGEWSARGCGPGGAAVLSSAADLLGFARWHLDDPTLAFLREEHATVAFPWFLDAWGLGWARSTGAGTAAPRGGWDGIGPGVRAILRVLPDHDAAIALLANTDTGRAVYRSLFPVVLRECFGVTMDPPPRKVRSTTWAGTRGSTRGPTAR